MTNLTEKLTRQLAEWSLPEHTEFYVRKKDGSTDTQTWINRKHSSPIEWWNIFNITEVLAPVPSYEEWQEKIEENIKLKTENKWYSEQLNEAVKKIDKLKEQQKIKADCKTLAKKLLQVKPELKEWLEVNFKEYL